MLAFIINLYSIVDFMVTLFVVLTFNLSLALCALIVNSLKYMLLLSFACALFVYMFVSRLSRSVIELTKQHYNNNKEDLINKEKQNMFASTHNNTFLQWQNKKNKKLLKTTQAYAHIQQWFESWITFVV